MLKKTNILALVGGGKNPQFSQNKIIIWDDHQGIIISEIRFNTNVIDLKIKQDKIIGICEFKIYVLNINTLEVIDILDTYENPNGICAITSGDLVSIIAYPYIKKGSVNVKN